MKVQIKFKKNKKNEYISLISIRDIEKTTSHSRQKSNLLKRIKQEKAEIRHAKHWNILQKSGQKIFKTAFMKKIYLFFKNLTPKKDCIFIETKLKSLMFPKILFLVIKSKIQTKNWKELAKNYEKRISKCTILWNKLHRGRKRHWVYELSKGSCHINWFLTKNS